MAYTVKKFGDYRERRSFSKSKNTMELSDLLEIQKKSYNNFLENGIKEVFEDLFPVESFTGNLSLEFGEYSFEEPRYSIKGCKERYATYAAPLKVEARLFNHETGEVKEQDIYLGDMPIMTESGTFVINGAERVIVSQLVRSPSVYFGKEIDSREIFDKLEIHSCEQYEQHLNQHDVIYITFNEMPNECRTYRQYISRIEKRLLVP